MVIQSVRHRGLRRLLEQDSVRYLPDQLGGRLRKILTALLLAEDMSDFIAVASPGWRVHRLSGDRSDEWSVSVSGNWRVTFAATDGRVHRLNLEDYH